VSIKTLLFLLFLYVCLVWVAAFGLHSGPEIEPFGLLWTAVGIIAVLAFVILSWAWGAWRLYRAKVRQRPPAPPKPVQKANPEDVAVESLIRDANTALARISAVGNSRAGADLRRLPLYLLTGPSGSGKTSTFANAGFEPHWLAGNAPDARRPVRTELMNLWFSGGAIFVELSGQAFTAGGETWLRLLKALRGEDRRPFWQRILRDKKAHGSISGVVGFCHARDLVGASSDPQRLETASGIWKDRLTAITEVFGGSFPVYQVISNCDAIPFFNEFFRKLPDAGIGQPLGSAVPPISETISETRDQRVRRLIDSFRALYRAIVERRVLHLAQESNTKIRPAIYEFPRELKKIRSALVQFLTDAIEFSPIEPGPRLCGYYLTATRETVALQGAVVPADDPSVANTEASRFFRGDATNIFQADAQSVAIRPGVSGVQWLFAPDIFGKVLPAGAPPKAVVVAFGDRRVERFRLLLMTATAALCLLMCIGFTISWFGNRDLLNRVQTTAEVVPPVAQVEPTLSALHALDGLRVILKNLGNRQGIGMHLGLYTGNRIALPLRAAYFERLQSLLLNGINSRLVEALQTADTSDAGLLYSFLRTHLMITTRACEPETRLVTEVLRKESPTPSYESDARQWQILAGRQIDYYAEELKHENPCHLTPSSAASNKAREALQRLNGVSTVYADIISAAEKGVARPTRLGDLAPGYEQTLAGPPDISPAFSPVGKDMVLKRAKDFHAGPVDGCAVGDRAGSKVDLNAIQAQYIRDYIENWRKYLAGFSVIRYKSAQDAAGKLASLSDHKSPLLALFALTSSATDFKPSVVSREMDHGSKVLGNLFNNGPSAKPTETMRRAIGGEFQDIGAVFQPVQWVVAPGDEKWVSDKNAAYLDSLAQLGHSMQDIADSKNPSDSAPFQSANQNAEKALDAVRQLAKGFKPAEAGGVDGIAERLLREPIEQARGFIHDPLENQKSRIEAQFQSLCRTVGPILRKYPFQSSSDSEATLQEFTNAFAPGTGAIPKFESEALGDLIVKDGAAWKVKDPQQKLIPTQRLLTLVNRAQAVTNAFFPPGATSPRLVYLLRPKLDAGQKGPVIELDVDGQHHRWDNSVQAQFIWPAPSGGKPGAVARAGDSNFAAGFASEEGTWAIFRIIGDAEPRALQDPVIVWKYTKGNKGRGVEITPAPIRLEVVELGADVFNPKFYEGLQCSGSAIQ